MKRLPPPALRRIQAGLSTSDPGFMAELTARLELPYSYDTELEERVERIVSEVGAYGDEALLRYASCELGARTQAGGALEISSADMAEAFDTLHPLQRTPLEQAAARITDFHHAQLAASGRSWEYQDSFGNAFGQRIVPLERVGIYVPAVSNSHLSSILMSAIPAKVAGVKEVVLATEAFHGKNRQLTLAAAHLIGVDRGFCIGGAQAIAALAYGTQSVPKVQKIVGSGDASVCLAKRRLVDTVGIEITTGPTQVVIIADGSTPPAWVAADLLSQAEHGLHAQSILLCPNADYIEAVQRHIDDLLYKLPRWKTAADSLNLRGALVRTRSMEEACTLSNDIAPERVEIASDQPRRWFDLITNAGAVLLGRFSSEALGNYCAGPSYVLPTAGSARFASGLGVQDFQKRISVMEISEQGATALGPIASELACSEGFIAHANAAEMRVQPGTLSQQD